MLNDWDSALTGHTSKVLFGNKLKEEICGSSKTKTKSKDVFKCISSSKRPFCEDSLSSCGDKGRGNRWFTFSFKSLNLSRGKKVVSTTIQKLASSSRPSPGSPISEVFVPKESSVLVPTGRKIEVFSERLRETVQWPSCSKYDFGLQGTLFGSTPSKQIPEAGSSVQGNIFVSSYRYPLLEKKAIKVIDSSQDKYLSSIFLVKKKDLNQRPFINL